MQGRPNREQLLLIRDAVQGRHVHDLGAGDGKLSNLVRELGAAGVTAIDKEWQTPPGLLSGVSYVREYFVDCHDPIDVALVSWPEQYADMGLSELVRRANVVIYLGKNTDGTVCGGGGLWCELIQREILSYEPDPKNTLIVYGPARVGRELRGEEFAACNLERIHRYAEVEKGDSTCKQGVGETQGI